MAYQTTKKFEFHSTFFSGIEKESRQLANNGRDQFLLKLRIHSAPEYRAPPYSLLHSDDSRSNFGQRVEGIFNVLMHAAVWGNYDDYILIG